MTKGVLRQLYFGQSSGSRRWILQIEWDEMWDLELNHMLVFGCGYYIIWELTGNEDFVCVSILCIWYNLLYFYIPKWKHFLLNKEKGRMEQR